MKKVAIAALACALLFGLVTYVALEADGVALVDTTDPRGEARTTHVWFVESDGTRWLEAGTPENPWYIDTRHHPELTLRTETASTAYVAKAIPGDDGHEWIRARMREKYGWRDAWVSLLFDTTESIAVRLEPAATR